MSSEIVYPAVDELREQIDQYNQRIQNLTMARDDAPDSRKPYYDQEIERQRMAMRQVCQAYDDTYEQMKAAKC